jgi:anhydro-N-acetylmuramic acid kinase
MSDLCIGMISGTSVDGIDVALVEIDGVGREASIHTVGFRTVPYPAQVRDELLSLYDEPTHAVARLCSLNVVVGRCFADAAVAICDEYDVDSSSLHVVGSHGQTVWHQPAHDPAIPMSVASTLQIGDPSMIAVATGAPVVSDFRVADMAVGGQGAPLAPYLDWAVLGDAVRTRCVQNIGGIGNVTWVPAREDHHGIVAFDTGPGNILIDGVVTCLSDGTLTFDRDGAFAATGTVDDEMLAALMQDPYLQQVPPKTTGREYYGMEQAQRWVQEWDLPSDAITNEGQNARDRACDLIATVTAWTAESIADAYRQFLPMLPDEVLVNGGGARNPTLMHMLTQRLRGIPVLPTDHYGVNADAKEAIAFALMAHDGIDGHPTNVPEATGASRAVPLGHVTRIPRPSGENEGSNVR